MSFPNTYSAAVRTLPERGSRASRGRARRAAAGKKAGAAPRDARASFVTARCLVRLSRHRQTDRYPLDGKNLAKGRAGRAMSRPGQGVGRGGAPGTSDRGGSAQGRSPNGHPPSPPPPAEAAMTADHPEREQAETALL
jgi:hypothetical protein